MTQRLSNYIRGQWQEGAAPFRALHNPHDGSVLAEASTEGVSFGSALQYARDQGGAALRALTFAQRGELLAEVSRAIHAEREALLDISTLNHGTTRSDGKFDIDGATGTLMYYAKLGQKLGRRKILREDDAVQLTRSPRLVGQHLWTPRQGVAILINAFNFPAWGFGEKAATAWLAGMPVFNKPATATALVAHRIHQVIVDAKILPEGAFNAAIGSVGDLLEHVQWQDVVAFTGSAATGAKIRQHPAIIRENVRVNVEADSVNAAVLAPDVDEDSEAFALFIREAAKDMTQKAGQKCTAMRRLLVPEQWMDAVQQALIEELSALTLGMPTEKTTKVGPLATASQQAEISKACDALEQHLSCVYQAEVPAELSQGYYVPTKLYRASGADLDIVHDVEVFGPVATLLPYDGTVEQAAHWVRRGGGSLVTSLYTDDRDFAQDFVLQAGASLGRIHIGSTKVAEHSPGPGTVLPLLQHGGPGRAGGGAELGAQSGLHLYMQRTAVQGFSPWLEAMLQEQPE